MHRNQIFRMVLKSMWNKPQEWYCDSHGKSIRFYTSVYWITNERLNVKIWTANGLPYFVLQKNEEIREFGSRYYFISNTKIKISVLQTLLLHIVYLRKIRKYPYIMILIRYLIAGVLSLGFISPMMCYLENFQNQKEVDMELEKSEKRNIILNEILN